MKTLLARQRHEKRGRLTVLTTHRPTYIPIKNKPSLQVDKHVPAVMFSLI